MESQSVIVQKSYRFALEIIKIYKFLKVEFNEFVLSKQILRSGTSIGANINEAQSAESKSDFVHKMSISLKEARETLYWINLLTDSGFISKKESKFLKDSCTEIIKILKSIILTTKEKYITKTQNSELRTQN